MGQVPSPSVVGRVAGGPYGAPGASLNLMVSEHMDDFKSIGPQASLNWLRDILSKAFGGDAKLEQESSFNRTGIKQIRVQEKNGQKFITF